MAGIEAANGGHRPRASARALLTPSSWPTNERGVREAFMVLAVASRIGLFVVAALPIVRGAMTSLQPMANVALVSLCLAASTGWMVHAVRRRALPSRHWLLVDAGATGVALATSSAWIAQDHLHNSWVGWPEFLALNACCIAAGSARRLRAAVAIGVAWATLWAVSVPPHLAASTWQDLIGTALNFVVYAALLHIIATFMLRIGGDADKARQQAAASAADAERHKAQVLMHNALNSFSRLTSEQTSNATTEPRALDQLKFDTQRMRTYIADDGTLQCHTAGTLGTCIKEATRGFDDIPICLNIQLGQDAPVSLEQREAVEAAVRAALQNVRQHANASEVVIHARADDDGWELTINDDGVGFDPSSPSSGFGVQNQIMKGLSSVDLECHIHSRPGDGTFIQVLSNKPISSLVGVIEDTGRLS